MDICTSKFKLWDEHMTSKTKLPILTDPLQYGTGNPGKSN